MNFVIFVLLLGVSGCNLKLLKRSDNIMELVTSAGYSGETHGVKTEDGYLLKVHRVLPKINGISTRKRPVFLMHGILATAADFLVTGPGIAMAFLLADNGYDVWLGNARGSQHCPKHQNFSSDSKEFWAFSWHEIGFYDLPAMIDYMLAETKAAQTFYVGHSQGTTSLLVLLSTRPEYNQKIAQAHLMAPSAFRKKLPRLKTITFGLEFLVRIV
jgi:pimeloyl-ACP methyl ester carboxylesterase